MPNWLTKLQPNPWLLRKLAMLAILVAVGVAAFCWGRRPHAGAHPGTEDPSVTGDYSRRAVAYLYNNQVTVTREELGEYLIARFGAERLAFMINRKIVEIECQKYNVTASDQEVEYRFQEDLKSFGTHLTEKEFVNSILRRFGKSLYEWKEDVIRPKIMMEKLVKATVTIGDKDIREGFDARYGPKVECRMIVIEKGNLQVAQKVRESARRSPGHFLDEARKQFIPNLAAEGGKVPAIHKHFGDKDLEDTAFRLKEGEISGLLQMKDGTYVILLCEKHLPANIAVRFEDERAALSKEMFELRVAQRIPEAFKNMYEQAAPRFVLNNTGQPSAGVIPSPQPLPLPRANTPPVVIPPVPVPQPVKRVEGMPELPDRPLPGIVSPATSLTSPTPMPMPPAPMPMPPLPSDKK